MWALLAFLGVAHARGLDGELSIELGTLQNGDRAYDLFSQGDGMPSRGVRAGVNLTDALVVVGGWHRVRRGAEVSVPGADGSFVAAFFADEFTLGPKAQAEVGDVFFPYVTTQALLFRGTMKLDDDPDTRHNTGQVSATALAPGVLALGGVELRSPSDRGDLCLGFFLEVGYGYVARAEYGDFGPMRPGGLAARGGLGVRF